MTQIDLSINLESPGLDPKDKEILKGVLEVRHEAGEFLRQDKYLEAMERTVAALKMMRDFSNYQNPEFRSLFVALLFDLAEIHYYLKNYKQSEKEVEILFKVLDNLVKSDQERFGQYHILAMELSTRILRSRKKALDLLVKQQITTGSLYEKVSSGIVAATDKLVDSLCTTAQLLAATGDIRGALKFYAEAIKYSKKRTGRVTRKEVKMTVEMAEVMIRLRSMQPRAKRLLNAILPHAVSLETVQLEQDILSLIEVIDANEEPETKWRMFLHKVIAGAKSKLKGKGEGKS
ncbi:MAG: hypothetical protein J1E78_07945 [Muribaculaceae bacterium]|nr:hypothetical protein [Muribaculaceae bacterium]